MFVVNADGLNNTLIVPEGCGPGVECDFAPSWSPFGDKIAFCSYRGNSWHIWTVNPDGSQLQQIPTTISVQDASYENESCYIRWSPDAKKIAFTGLTANIPYASRYNVYTMNIDGSNLVQLTNCQISGGGGASVCSMPSWSPDGTKIAFDCRVDAGNDDLCSVNADGTGFARLTTDPARDYGAAWKPDGSTLAFATTRYLGDQIALLNVADGGVIRAGLAGFSPTWSPNCWYMPTSRASAGLIFSRATLKHSRTSALLSMRRPAASIL